MYKKWPAATKNSKTSHSSFIILPQHHLSKMSQDGEKTYNSFIDSYDIPYTIVTLLYILALLVISFIVAVMKCSKCSSDTCSDYVTRFSSWLVRLVFGKSEGVSEDKVDEEALQVDGKILYINDEKMSKLDINILGTIVLCFGLLMFITAYSTYLLEVSHTCSEDTAIYCFPRFIGQIPENESFMITEDDLNYPITDCSQWVNSTIGPLVTFQCFRYAYNLQAALGTAGGLLALFVVAMRITMSIILKIFTLAEKYNCSKRLLHALQIVAVIILLIFDIAASVIIMSFQLYDSFGETETEQDPVAQQTASYIADNGIQFLIIIGTATLLLLVNWSRYAKKTENARVSSHKMEKVEKEQNSRV